MKPAATVFAVLFGLAPYLIGSPVCTSGTLATYEALGSGGCTIGSTTFSGFNTPSGISLSSAIAPGAIDISPSLSTGNLSLTITVSETAANNSILEALINYTISGSSYNSISIGASGTSSSGNGAVTEIENFCPGGSFNSTGVAGCSTTNAGNLVLLGDGTTSAAFAPVTFLGVTDDITFDGGGSGTANSAAGGVFTQTVALSAASVPEPRTFLLVIAGALSIFLKTRNRN